MDNKNELPTMNFPKPIYIGQRRYWKELDVPAWLEDQAEVAVQ